MTYFRRERFYGFKSEITVPKALLLNDRIVNDLSILAEYTIKLEKELGGYLIRNSNGNLGVMGLQKGEGRQVDVQPNEPLQGKEVYLGTQHFHPITDTFSIWDVGTFLANPKEFISGVTGANGDMNLLLKTSETQQIPLEAVPALDKMYKQSDIPKLADEYKFLYYKGKLSSKKLKIVNKQINSNGTMSVDEFTRAIKGLNEIPDFGDSSVITRKVRKRDV